MQSFDRNMETANWILFYLQYIRIIYLFHPIIDSIFLGARGETAYYLVKKNNLNEFKRVQMPDPQIKYDQNSNILIFLATLKKRQHFCMQLLIFYFELL